MISVRVVREDAAEDVMWLRVVSHEWRRDGARRVEVGEVAVSRAAWRRRPEFAAAIGAMVPGRLWAHSGSRRRHLQLVMDSLAEELTMRELGQWTPINPLSR